MALRLIITVLCGVGLYVSVFMLAKTRRGERGELSEPSVVQTPRARLFVNTPNALLGVVYYAAVAAGIWVIHAPLLWSALIIASVLAAVTSAYLAYSLLFVTRMPCPYCWTSHAINWMLLTALVALVNLSYWR